MGEVENYSNEAIKLIMAYGPKLILAVVVLIIGLVVIGSITKASKKLMEKRGVDEMLRPFLAGMLGTVLKIMLVISVMGMIGIEMTSFIAILGSVGLAIGLALSGTLQNFAGGVLLLILKPFKVGDFIETQGYTGVVKEIQIFNTILNTPDNKRVIIPNAPVATGAMVNFSTMDTRRVDLTFGIGYGDDIDKARDLIFQVINAKDNVLKDPAPFVAVSELGDSSVNFVVRIWVNAPDYWDVFFYMNENVKKTFDREGVSIPFPQMDVHLDK